MLAGTSSKYGVQFVTWDWDHDRKSVSHGHYFTGNYEGAKQDFATRSGLISEQQLFKDEQEKCIRSVQEQIRNGMPNIIEFIREQDLHTAELDYGQEPKME